MTRRRLVVTVCPRERGKVILAVHPGGRPVRMDATALARQLETVVARRGLGERVRIREGCAGGCARSGPNVDVEFQALTGSGEPGDNVAVGRRTYVYTLSALDCLARVIDDNLDR